ncbi:hypothetical protein Tco_0915935 [Tanacetum coccineum]
MAHEAASSFNIEEWEDIRARIEADEELAQRLQAEEREKYPEAEKARLLIELINQCRKRHLPTKSLKNEEHSHQYRLTENYMSNYISIWEARHYSIERGYSLMMNPELVSKIAAGSSKMDAEEELGQESSKRQKIGESSQQAKEPDELSQEELHQLMIIVGNHTEVYQVLEDMLKTFDRDDLVKLWSLVQERFNSTEPTEDKEIEIWVELKRLFEPDVDDELWKS